MHLSIIKTTRVMIAQSIITNWIRAQYVPIRASPILQRKDLRNTYRREKMKPGMWKNVKDSVRNGRKKKAETPGFSLLSALKMRMTGIEPAHRSTRS